MAQLCLITLENVPGKPRRKVVCVLTHFRRLQLGSKCSPRLSLWLTIEVSSPFHVMRIRFQHKNYNFVSCLNVSFLPRYTGFMTILTSVVKSLSRKIIYNNYTCSRMVVLISVLELRMDGRRLLTLLSCSRSSCKDLQQRVVDLNS